MLGVADASSASKNTGVKPLRARGVAELASRPAVAARIRRPRVEILKTFAGNLNDAAVSAAYLSRHFLAEAAQMARIAPNARWVSVQGLIFFWSFMTGSSVHMATSTSPLLVCRGASGAIARGISLAGLLLVGSLACSSDPEGSSDGSGGSGAASSSSGAPAGVSGASVSSSTTGSAGSTTGTGGSGGAPAGATTGSGATGSGGEGAGGAPAVSSSSSSVSGGSPDPGFQPCPETGPCKILPLGDSITFGLGFDGGYRVELFHLALQDDHEITFTGTQQMNGPAMVDGVTFPRNHEGISGETIQQIANRVPTPALRDMPHIVLLHAGTNDMVRGADGAATRLAALLDELIAEAPDALIVVGNIIPLPFAPDAVNTFNAAIPGLVEERASAGAHIIFVDQFTGFPTSELGDQVHPNQAGYARMARAWYGAISDYLR
ncbi:SGNH/GDSL hydrolase family protein [Sorangium sp. So ce134]